MRPHTSTDHHGQAPLLVTVPEAAELLGIGRSKLYELILDGTITTVSIGRARRIPVAALHDYVNQLQLVTPSHPTDTLRNRRTTH